MMSIIHKKLEKYVGKVVNTMAKYLLKVVNPKCLQKIDRNFLLNRPKFWSLKLHYILYYALIADFLIAFLVVIFPISSPTQLPKLLITGLVIIPIAETILLFYWLYIQFLLNRERRYGHIRKWNGLLELLSYSVCITLIASGLIVFLLVIQFKVKPVIPRTQLAIDLITLDAIQREELVDSKDYFQALKTYVNSDEFKTLQKESIFSEKYNDEKERHFRKTYLRNKYSLFSKIRTETFENKEKYYDYDKLYELQSLPYNQLCFLSDDNDNLRKYWQTKIAPETRIFVEYDDNVQLENFLQCSLFKDLSNNKDFELLQKSGFNDLVKKIKNNKIKEVINPMLKYVQLENTYKNILKFEQFIEKYKQSSYVELPLLSQKKTSVIREAIVALLSASDLYRTFYTFNTLQFILYWYYFLVNLISLLLLLFYSTYMVDFIFALVYIFLLVAVLWTAALSSSSSSLSLKPEEVILFFIILPTIIVSWLAVSKRKIKRYWRFKVLNLVAFPFALVVSVFCIIELLEMNKIFPMNNEGVYIYASIYRPLALLSYIPIVPLLKNELLRQLKLPKD